MANINTQAAQFFNKPVKAAADVHDNAHSGSPYVVPWTPLVSPQKKRKQPNERTNLLLVAPRGIVAKQTLTPANPWRSKAFTDTKHGGIKNTGGIVSHGSWG